MRRVFWVARNIVGYSLLSTLFFVGVSYAQTPSSSNYQLKEDTIGSGGLNDSTSASYNVTNSVGDLGVGNTASGNFQAETGSQTNDAPTLSFALESSPSGFGALSPATTATATANFSVKNYTSYGYIVQVTGSSPTNSPKVITPLATPSDPVAGISQFGINLVHNTLPLSFGTNLDNGQFGFGQVDSNYGTPNKYKYTSGDIIARAPKSSGKTVYTISYIINVEPLTPGGQYTAAHTLIVTGTY
jgi:hypothetical protein